MPSLNIRRLGVAGLASLTLLLTACAEKAPEGGGEGGPGGGGHGGPPPPVQVEELRAHPVKQTAEYLGNLISRQSVQLFPQVSGYVERIDVKPGARVKVGQVLLRIDSRQERAALEQARASKSQSEASLDLARRTRERAEVLFKDGVLSRQAFDEASSRAQAAEATSVASDAAVRAREVQLRFHDIISPFEGVVGDIPVKVGDFVAPQVLLTSVDQSEALELSVSVPVARASQVRIGETELEVLDDQGKPQVSAKVFFVAPRPAPQTQLVELKAAFKNTLGLRQGQYVRARLVLDERPAITISAQAITRQSGQAFVFGVLPGDKGGSKVERRPVELGQLQDNQFVVEKGLKDGDKVAVNMLQVLQDGMPITPTAPGAQGTPPGTQGAAGGAKPGQHDSGAGGSGAPASDGGTGR